MHEINFYSANNHDKASSKLTIGMNSILRKQYKLAPYNIPYSNLDTGEVHVCYSETRTTIMALFLLVKVL